MIIPVLREPREKPWDLSQLREICSVRPIRQSCTIEIFSASLIPSRCVLRISVSLLRHFNILSHLGLFKAERTWAGNYWSPASFSHFIYQSWKSSSGAWHTEIRGTVSFIHENEFSNGLPILALPDIYGILLLWSSNMAALKQISSCAILLLLP